MGFLTVRIIDGQIALVPDDAALAILNAQSGEVIGVSRDSDGRMTLTNPVDRDSRISRGKAFLDRYRQTFEDLAK